MLPAVVGSCLLLFAAPAPVPAPPKNPDAAADGVLARAFWQPPAALRRGSHNYVFRDGKALAEAMKVTGEAADDTATAQLATALGVKTIDWQKQMVVTVAAGLKGADVDRLFITRVHVQDDVWTLYYELRAAERPQPAPGEPEDAKATAKGPGGFGYPAETVLVNRFNGTMRFRDETPAK